MGASEKPTAWPAGDSEHLIVLASNKRHELRSGSEEGSYVRLVNFCITQL